MEDHHIATAFDECGAAGQIPDRESNRSLERFGKNPPENMQSMNMDVYVDPRNLNPPFRFAQRQEAGR